jgi:hypothetical protein
MTIFSYTMKESIVPPFHSLNNLLRLLFFSCNVQRSDSLLFSSADAAALPILEYISIVDASTLVFTAESPERALTTTLKVRRRRNLQLDSHHLRSFGESSAKHWRWIQSLPRPNAVVLDFPSPQE